MTDSLCRKRKLADSFIPCEVITSKSQQLSHSFRLKCFPQIIVHVNGSKYFSAEDSLSHFSLTNNKHLLNANARETFFTNDFTSFSKIFQSYQACEK